VAAATGFPWSRSRFTSSSVKVDIVTPFIRCEKAWCAALQLLHTNVLYLTQAFLNPNRSSAAQLGQILFCACFRSVFNSFSRLRGIIRYVDGGVCGKWTMLLSANSDHRHICRQERKGRLCRDCAEQQCGARQQLHERHCSGDPAAWRIFLNKQPFMLHQCTPACSLSRLRISNILEACLG
jgi:hypothetical protein